MEKHKITIKNKFKSLKSPLKKGKLNLNDSDLKEKEKEEEEQKMTEQKTYNEDFINILGQLKEIQSGLGDHFRSSAYGKAEEEIIKYKEPIYNAEQIKHLPHIGKTIIEKLNEYIKTGKLKAIEKEKNNPILFLTKIHGIGPKKAEELIKKDIITIEKLKENIKSLNAKQQIGLQYFEEINQKIPRSEIEEYKELFIKIFQEVAPEESSFEIVGSYRRGAVNSGDIDIIITNKNNKITAYTTFLDKLIKDKIIVEILSRGATKSMTIARLPNDKAVARRIDFLYAPPDEYAFAILYFTGSKYFNVVMRHRALDLGFSLNEHGLSRVIDKQKVEELSHKFPNEESIFEFLNLIYKTPEERKSGQAVELIGSTTKSKQESLQKESLKPEIFTIKVKKTTLKKKFISNEDLLVKVLKEGITGLKKMSEQELTQLIQKANNEYYCNTSPIMTDNQYDILREYTLEHYPNNEVAKEGHKMCDIAIQRNKVKLPYEMWSMDKIKPDTNAIDKWKKKYKGPYMLSAKLDGMSALYTTEGGEPKLYTRGNGTTGYDISYFIPYLKLPKDKNITIRGELIISKENFEKYKTQKTKSNKDIANPRNFVAGVINQKTVEAKKIKDIDFVAYEVITPSLEPTEQIKLLESFNINTVINKTEKEINNEILSKILINWRESYKYEIDGIICINNEIYPRPQGNPEYAFAFKMVLSDQIAEAKVIDILWSATKDGYLSPRVQIEPIKLRGSTINFVTGKNAKFIEDNKIGIGAIIKLVKAGDVIPEIAGVITPAPEALFPNEPYIWNESHIEIMLENKEDDERVLEKNIETFFKSLEVDGLGPGLVSKIVKAGYTSVPAILAMTQENFLKIEGFKKKLTEKIYNNIQEQITKVSLAELMVGSNVFGRGFGEKKIQLILSELPNILISKEDEKTKIGKLNKVSGLAGKTSEKFVAKIPEFIKFLERANLQYKLTEKKDINKSIEIESHELNGKKIVTTGFRFDKKMLEKLEKINIIIQDTINKETFLLIVKDIEDGSVKVSNAKEKKIPIISQEEFLTKYNLL